MINLLIDALREITNDYVEYKNDAGMKCKHLERIFAYELYRQWANKLEKPENNPNKLILHGEIVKGFENQTKRYPDFVLHGSQGDFSHQEIVCEIKRNKNFSKKSFIGDLNKISEFFNSDKTFSHPFSYGVFILVGGNMNCIQNYSKNLPNKIVKNADKIYIISHRGNETFDIEKDVKKLDSMLYDKK